MSMNKPYWQRLQDPRWQKKRLQVLERTGFICEDCRAADKTLHVHHSYYQKGMEPWEYPDRALHGVCNGCHEERAEAERKLLQALFWFSASGIAAIAEAFTTAEAVSESPDTTIPNVCAILARQFGAERKTK